MAQAVRAVRPRAVPDAAVPQERRAGRAFRRDGALDGGRIVRRHAALATARHDAGAAVGVGHVVEEEGDVQPDHHLGHGRLHGYLVVVQHLGPPAGAGDIGRIAEDDRMVAQKVGHEGVDDRVIQEVDKLLALVDQGPDALVRPARPAVEGGDAGRRLAIRLVAQALAQGGGLGRGQGVLDQAIAEGVQVSLGARPVGGRLWQDGGVEHRVAPLGAGRGVAEPHGDGDLAGHLDLAEHEAAARVELAIDQADEIVSAKGQTGLDGPIRAALTDLAARPPHEPRRANTFEIQLDDAIEGFQARGRLAQASDGPIDPRRLRRRRYVAFDDVHPRLPDVFCFLDSNTHFAGDGTRPLNLHPGRPARPIRDPGANAQPKPLGPGYPLRYGRDDVVFVTADRARCYRAGGAGAGGGALLFISVAAALESAALLLAGVALSAWSLSSPGGGASFRSFEALSKLARSDGAR